MEMCWKRVKGKNKADEEDCLLVIDEAEKLKQWLENATYFNKEYCKAVKRHKFQELIDFAGALHAEFSDKEIIDPALFKDFYKQKSQHILFDFFLHQITNFKEDKVKSFESLLRHALLPRNQSAPFNDIFYFEENEPEFWSKFKEAEILVTSIYTKVVKKDIGINISKSDMPVSSSLAAANGVSGWEMKESEGWTEEFLRQYALASAEAVAAGQRAPMLDDCTISGNHGMWSEASNGFRADFLLALGVSEGIKLDLKFLQELTFSVTPIGIPDAAAFKAVENDVETIIVPTLITRMDEFQDPPTWNVPTENALCSAVKPKRRV